MFRSRFVKLSMLSGVCIAASVTHGETISQTYSVPSETVIGGATTSTTVPKNFVTNFNQFNPALGTLTGVDIDFVYDFLLTLNLGPDGGGGSGSAGGPIYINGFSDPAPTGTGNGTGNGGGPNQVLLLPFATNTTYATTASLGGFVGVGTGSVEYAASGFVSPPVGGSASLALQGTSSVKVTYTYSVPEPATAYLFGIGGVGLLARRRRSQSLGRR